MNFSNYPLENLLIAASGDITTGLALGSFSVIVHIPVPVALCLSILIYNGAIQSVFIGFWSVGIEPVSVIYTAILLNLRYLLYGVQLRNSFAGIDLRHILKLAPFMTDEIYALSNRETSFEVLVLTSWLGYIFFVFSTAAGLYLTNLIPDQLIISVSTALPALFVSIVVPKIKDVPAVITASAAGFSAIVTKLVGAGLTSFIIPVIIGSFAGVLINLRSGIR